MWNMLTRIHQTIISLGWIYVICVIGYILGFLSAIVLIAGKWEDVTLKTIDKGAIK